MYLTEFVVHSSLTRQDGSAYLQRYVFIFL